MSELKNKVDTLAGQVDSIRSKTVSVTRITAVVYCVLVVFVIGYTSFIMGKINELVTPEIVSTHLRMTLEDQLPSLRADLVKASKDMSPQLADYLVNSSKAMIPSVEDKLKNIIDLQVNNLTTSIKSDIQPVLVTIIDDNAKEINFTADTLKDEAAANQLARALVDEIEIEIEKAIGGEFRKRIALLDADLDAIANKPLSMMTRREAAERKLIASWVFLLQHSKSEQNILSGVMENIASYFDYLKGEY
jgi:hypothetical protein